MKEACRDDGRFTQDEVTRRLEQTGITAIFSRNEDGRLTGATFIDNTERNVFNGSNLSNNKEFTANTWEREFAEAAHIVADVPDQVQSYPQEIEFPVPERATDAPRAQRPQSGYREHPDRHAAFQGGGGAGIIEGMLSNPEVIEEIDPAFAPDWMIPKKAKKKVKKKVIKLRK